MEVFKMFGSIQLEQFKGLTTMPQKAATAFSAVEKLIGAKYLPLLYLGSQVVKGVNYYFIAEQTIMNQAQDRNVVILCVNESGGKYVVVPHSIQKII